MNKVKYKIWGECNITIDTENFMNKVYEVIYSRSSTSSRVNEPVIGLVVI